MKIWILAMLTLLLGIGVANAATFTHPAAGATVSGAAVIFNVSVTLNNVTNMTLSCTSSASGGTIANSTEATCRNTTTSEKTYINCTMNTFNGADASDYSCTGTVKNLSGSTETVTARTIVVDNTNPVCTLTSGQTSNNAYDNEDTWTVTGTNGTAAAIAFGGNSYTMTESSDTFSFSSRVPDSIYDTVQITVTDGADTTSCTALEYITIQNDDNTRTIIGAGVAVEETQTQQEKAKQQNVAIAIILLVVIVIAIQGKKGK